MDDETAMKWAMQYAEKLATTEEYEGKSPAQVIEAIVEAEAYRISGIDNSEMSEYEAEVANKQAELKQKFGLPSADFEEVTDLEAERAEELSAVEKKQQELREKRREGR